jgi:1-acyl-sn-glycerol-3-phosphate acyltransferase
MKWHPLFHGFIRHLYFSRITVTGRQHVPATGPLMVLCLHRNGAVDAFVDRAAVAGMTFMVKAGLRHGMMGRLFFDGVEVVRSSDGARPGDNLEALETCVQHLRDGKRLGIFPEGTSQLGPRHLPFKSGAARIALRYLEAGKPLTVVALGLHYECPWAFRSRVEVVIGPPFTLAPGSRLGEIKERFTRALEEVGVNVPDGEWQDLAQKFAYIATLGTGRRYFDALKSFERRLPAEAVAALKNLEDKARGRRVLRHQGVPLFPLRMPAAYVILTALLAIPVITGALLNLPPLAVAYWAGRCFPDDTNVIALWRILTGVPLLLLWAAGWLLTAAALGSGGMLVAYPVLSGLAVLGCYRLKKLAVVAWNGTLHPDLRDDALAVRHAVLAALETPSHENSLATAVPTA